MICSMFTIHTVTEKDCVKSNHKYVHEDAVDDVSEDNGDDDWTDCGDEWVSKPLRLIVNHVGNEETRTRNKQSP